ncbi:MAG: two-component system nitrogen regulation response regulator GlnG [bacterium]|jgi:two-component system nitrogen regulation response regulator GlnG
MNYEKTTTILIIDDEESIRWVLSKTLDIENYKVFPFSNGEDAIQFSKKMNADICLIDLNLPGMDGFSVMEELKKLLPQVVPIIMTGQSTMRNTIDAIQKGAFDYISKPFDIDEVESIVQNAAKESFRRKNSKESSISKNKTPIQNDLIIGKSRSVQLIYKAIGKVANTDLTVLIKGESGTGKELIARSLHENSDRVTKPFIAINCAAIPSELLESELFGYVKGAFTGAHENRKGKFELAAGGTLFLDEIGDMPMPLQTKLLRVLQEKEFEPIGSGQTIRSNVRIVTATNKDLPLLIQENLFREDLYYRVNVFTIHSPALREREGDIELLIQHFLKKGALDMLLPSCSISQNAIRVLSEYSWPGNVRELENTIKSLMIICSGSSIDIEHIPQHIAPKEKVLEIHTQYNKLSDWLESKIQDQVTDYCQTEENNLYENIIHQVEYPLLKLVLQETKWNQLKAAKILGINRNTLRKKINDLQLKKE